MATEPDQNQEEEPLEDNGIEDPDCIYCGDTGVVLYGDTEYPCGACYSTEDWV